MNHGRVILDRNVYAQCPWCFKYTTIAHTAINPSNNGNYCTTLCKDCKIDYIIEGLPQRFIDDLKFERRCGGSEPTTWRRKIMGETKQITCPSCERSIIFTHRDVEHQHQEEPRFCAKCAMILTCECGKEMNVQHLFYYIDRAELAYTATPVIDGLDALTKPTWLKDVKTHWVPLSGTSKSPAGRRATMQLLRSERQTNLIDTLLNISVVIVCIAAIVSYVGYMITKEELLFWISFPTLLFLTPALANLARKIALDNTDFDEQSSRLAFNAVAGILCWAILCLVIVFARQGWTILNVLVPHRFRRNGVALSPLEFIHYFLPPFDIIQSYN